jgi:ABC-type antimicrobial peptide transport system permease subunit
MRSFLTMLGIIIGVSAVIIIMAVGAGAQSLILDQIKGIGTDLIGIQPGKSDSKEPPASVMGIVIATLTYEDALALAKVNNVPDLTSVEATVKGVVTVSWENNEVDTNLNGTMASYPEAESHDVEAGRFFTADEERGIAKVVVLGSKVKDDIFGQSDAIGQKLKIKKHTFQVIGVMKKKGSVAFQDYDDQIMVPITAAQKLILGINYVNMIRGKVDSEDNIPKATEDIEKTLRERHGISDQSGAGDDFTVRNAAQALDMVTTVTDALKYFLAAMAAISLVVGGIGIMNIMLVSVSERTREIGLRKAVGARRSDILIQFLTESIIITLTGGIIGIAAGALVSLIIALGAHAMNYQWDYSVSFLSIALGVGVSSFVGLVFGIYPASKAGKLDPIEALRYE